MTGREGEADQLARRLSVQLPLPLGSLCVWGDWFGRPLDNLHVLVAVRVEAEVLNLTFHEDETLLVTRPRGWQLTPSTQVGHQTLRIADADRVRWEWFYYGRPKHPENRFYVDHRREGRKIYAATNWTVALPNLNPSTDEPAVTFL